MTEHDDPELERLLRQALHQRAEQITPAGDGLTRIRERIERRRLVHWLRPAAAVVAAAAAAVAVIALPNALNGSGGPSHRSAANQPANRTAGSPSAGPTAPATPQQSPAVAAPTIDAPLAWPYSTAEGARRHATDLGDPAKLAADFVEAFAGSGAPSRPLRLLTRFNGATSDQAPSVEVFRKDTGIEICTVHLTRIADRPVAYGVLDATSSQLRVKAVTGLAHRTATLGVAGDVYAGHGATNLVRVDLRAPGQHAAGSPAVAFINPNGVEDQGWKAVLNPAPVWPKRAVLAAWTNDSHGLVVDFTATPVQPG